jgi:hypothetical protein
MTNPKSMEQREMHEPQPAPEGADLGGLHSTAEAGVGRAMQRSTERGEADPIGPASTGNASGGAQTPRLDLGGKAEPGSAPGTTAGDRRPAADARGEGAPAGGAAGTGATGTSTAGGASGGATRTSADWGDDEDEWRHEPREPVDENPLKSFGRAVGDALTGSVDDPAPAKPPR